MAGKIFYLENENLTLAVLTLFINAVNNFFLYIYTKNTQWSEGTNIGSVSWNFACYGLPSDYIKWSDERQ